MSNVQDKRIAKNTVFLYIRTLVIMFISLYTSRVILKALGVEDFGVYNAVAGVVSMFGVLSAALSISISRFITYELGKNHHDIERLQKLFSTSLNIQFFLSFIILIIGETVGLLFLNYKLNIPPDRLVAANWVWQCTLIAFIVNLLSVPYNASIIAHEHMSTFAYVSIFDAILKLGTCFVLFFLPWDKLIIYAILHVIVALLVRFIYVIYCKRNFSECQYILVKDKSLAKEMFGFASFSFLNNTTNILNSQGLNILINIYFSVIYNAARGIATQVEGAIMQLVNNLTVAVNPQITKSYAIGDKDRVYNLVCQGTKYSYYLLLFFAIPVILETSYILHLWLVEVPYYAVTFTRLSLLGAMVKMLGNTGYTACMATGTIKRYSIWITSVGIMAFPLAWVAFSMGAPAEYAYYVFIVVYILVEIVRLMLMKQMLDFPISMFLREVILNIFIVTPIVLFLPILVYSQMNSGVIRFLTVLIISILSTLIGVYAIGLKKSERLFVNNILKNKLHR